MKKLGERGRQVEHGTGHVELMQIAGDGAGQHILLHGRRHDVPRETAAPVPHVEPHSVLDRLSHLAQHAPPRIQNTPGMTVKRVRDDVAFLQKG